MKKFKWIIFLSLLLSVTFTAGCQAKAQTKPVQVYPVQVTKRTIKDDGSFELKGTTKAPTGSIVMAEYQYPGSPQKHVNKAYPDAKADYAKIDYPRVRHHQFSVILNANNELKAGQKLRVKIFAVAHYGKLINPNHFSVVKIPVQIQQAAKPVKLQPIHLYVSQQVIKRYPTVPIN